MKTEVVEFRSIPEYYEKEKFGLKPNTIRELPISGEREEKLKNWSYLGEYGQIIITNTDTGESFIRDVTDVTIWKNWVIISWRHPTK